MLCPKKSSIDEIFSKQTPKLEDLLEQEDLAIELKNLNP
jgi:hypothetical protein